MARLYTADHETKQGYLRYEYAQDAILPTDMAHRTVGLMGANHVFASSGRGDPAQYKRTYGGYAMKIRQPVDPVGLPSEYNSDMFFTNLQGHDPPRWEFNVQARFMFDPASGLQLLYTLQSESEDVTPVVAGRSILRGQRTFGFFVARDFDLSLWPTGDDDGSAVFNIFGTQHKEPEPDGQCLDCYPPAWGRQDTESRMRMRPNRWYDIRFHFIYGHGPPDLEGFPGIGVFTAWVEGVKVMEVYGNYHNFLNPPLAAGSTNRKLYWGYGDNGPEFWFDNVIVNNATDDGTESTVQESGVPFGTQLTLIDPASDGASNQYARSTTHDPTFPATVPFNYQRVDNDLGWSITAPVNFMQTPVESVRSAASGQRTDMYGLPRSTDFLPGVRPELAAAGAQQAEIYRLYVRTATWTNGNGTDEQVAALSVGGTSFSGMFPDGSPIELKNDGTQGDGGGNNVGFYQTRWDANPLTSGVWTPDDIDGLEIGVLHSVHKAGGAAYLTNIGLVVEHDEAPIRKGRANEGFNILQNPGAERIDPIGVPYWSGDAGWHTWVEGLEGLGQRSGRARFQAAPEDLTTLFQTVNLSGCGFHFAPLLDAGLMRAYGGGWIRTRDEAARDTGLVSMDFMDSGLAVLGSVSGSAVSGLDWTQTEISGALPSGTRNIRFNLTAERNTAGDMIPNASFGTNNDAAFDDVFLKLKEVNQSHPAESGSVAFDLSDEQALEYALHYSRNTLPSWENREFMEKSADIWKSNASGLYLDAQDAHQPRTWNALRYLPVTGVDEGEVDP